MTPVWTGTEAEADAFREALNKWCTCRVWALCAGHKAALKDQAFVSGMIFERRRAEELKGQEQSQ